jgi:hypothetical protein
MIAGQTARNVPHLAPKSVPDEAFFSSLEEEINESLVFVKVHLPFGVNETLRCMVNDWLSSSGTLGGVAGKG